MADTSISQSSGEGFIDLTDRTPPFRVLVVEDSLLQRKLMAIMLKQLGYIVTTANNGLEALSALQLAPYDIILMDCQLPFMDGLKATERIRTNEERAKQPVVIIGISSDASLEECLKAGMNDFLPKPVSRSILGKLLFRWTQKADHSHRTAETI